MSSIWNVAVKRPVTTTMALLIVVAFGILSLQNIQLDMMPNMNIPMAVVSTGYDGAGSEEVENLVTSPLEAALATITGVEAITSTSSYGSSMIMLEFTSDTNIDNAALDMRERIDLVKAVLPEDADEPMVLKIDINSMTTMQLVIGSDQKDLVELKGVVDEKIVSRLERQEGVASVDIAGGREVEIEIILQEDKLRGYGISESTVSQLIRSENISSPTGSLKRGDLNLSLRVQGEFQSLEDIKSLPITTSTGTVIFLEDIAEVKEIYKEADSIVYMDNIPAVMLTINKQSTANTVNMSDAVLKELTKLIQEYPDLQFSIASDPADFIRLSISTVASSAVTGGLFAIIILYIFLRNIRPTFIVAVSIPISIIATFIMMYYANLTLNILSLGGLALGVGMLVDNSIVVLESVYRKIEQGVENQKAAIDGTREVAMSVMASTLTTVAVFLPITFAGGLAAEIFNELALTIAFSLLSSLLVALTFVPMACSLYLKIDSEEDLAYRQKNPISMLLNLINSGIDSLSIVYKHILKFCITKRKITYLTVLIFSVCSLSSISLIGFEFLPESDESTVSISIKMPKGTVLSQTESKLFEILNLIDKEKYYIEDILASISGDSDTASIQINLPGKEYRELSSKEIAHLLEQDLSIVPGADISVSALSTSMGSYGGTGAEIQIKGDDLDTLTDIAYELTELFKTINGVTSVSNSLGDGTPQATIIVDRAKAAAFGLTGSSVTSIINTAVSGSVVTTYKVDGDEYDIRIRQEDSNFEFISDIESILIPTQTGANVPLYEIATLEEREIPIAINRENQQKYITISCSGVDVSTSDLTSGVTNIMNNYLLPDDYSWDFSGTAEQMAETFGSLAFALIAAVFIVYMIMAAEFESYIYPFLVMFSIPVAMTGGIFGLFIINESLAVTGFVGLIMLAGIVVNNAIVLVDYTNLLRKEENLSVTDALLKAGPVRLRPILMTTLTTSLALVPMIFATGDGSEQMRGMSGVVVFGLLFSTLVTLLFIPTLYQTMAVSQDKKRARKEKRLAKKQAKRK